MLQINQIKIDVSNDNKEALKKKIIKILRISPSELSDYIILRKSVDARKKPDVKILYSVAVALKDKGKEKKLLAFKHKDIILYQRKELEFKKSALNTKNRPVIIGAGPAGLFAALILSMNGSDPIILERGKKISERDKDINKFWDDGTLNPESNVSFGEGGAGTFSDGKLNTQINDKSGRNTFVLDTFVECGAPENIKFDAKPHIGTDILKDVITNLRKKIEGLGGEFRFSSCVTDFVINDNKICGVQVNNKEIIPCDTLILAIGHSARDTIEKLHERKVPMTAKEFAMGFRVEHKREFIDFSQYDTAMKYLPAASYKLTANLPNKRGVYSFCMCPGGYVVNASSEDETTVVNGMSYSGRNGENSNSAIIITVGKDEFSLDDPLGAIKYQRSIEKKAYQLGKGKIPQQLFGDFTANRISTSYGAFSSCTKGETVFKNLREIFSEEINQSFIDAMNVFNNKIKGFSDEECILSGVESRTSSPVRITRDQDGHSLIEGLFPAGEGAGYAGGIMSAAMDGIKIAMKVMNI